MADDTTTDDSTVEDTATAEDETSQPVDDLAGLKSALAAEREQRKALEKQARTNAKAAEELEKLKAASMSEQEKAVAQARKEGETSALVAAGRKLAEARFDAALARKGLDLGDAADLIDVGKFVDDKGDVDDDAIKKAVARLAKLAPKAPSTSGGDFGGGNGGGTPAKNLRDQIREAEAKGDWKLSRQLKTQLALQQTSQ